MVEKTQTGWSEPANLGLPVNTPSQEFYPSVSTNGTLYFSSNRDGGKGSGDIYHTQFVNGKYSTPENLGDSINTKTFEGDPYIAPDENFLILTAYNRSDGLGDGDLYISLNRDGHWTPGEKSG